MRKVLVAVDDTKGSKAVLSVFGNLVRPPEEVILLHVERLEGGSLMIDMLSDSELSTLKDAIRGTEHKEALDRRAGKVLDYYKKEIEGLGLVSVRTMVREGIPSEEILRVAEEEDVEMIITGCNGKSGLDRLFTGCVSKDVEKNSRVPVLVAKDSKETKQAHGAYAGLKLKETF